MCEFDVGVIADVGVSVPGDPGVGVETAVDGADAASLRAPRLTERSPLRRKMEVFLPIPVLALEARFTDAPPSSPSLALSKRRLLLLSPSLFSGSDIESVSAAEILELGVRGLNKPLNRSRFRCREGSSCPRILRETSRKPS